MWDEVLEWLHVENLKYLRGVVSLSFLTLGITFAAHRRFRSRPSAVFLTVALYVTLAVVWLVPLQFAIEGDWFAAAVVSIGVVWLVRSLLDGLAAEL
ncbi:hypothetical protein [Deinococcus planocerae]|uniref:hypothetical protein n=1 Tax=Deinococcus planocerae TaxID=1737569 RepID=UPI0011AEF9C2|nr:hypothetical protein [Deinococcus planocerae]